MDDRIAVVFSRIGGVLLLAYFWVLPWLTPKSGGTPAAYYPVVALASVVLLLWVRRMRQVWFDGEVFIIGDWFSRRVEIPKAHLVKVRVVDLKSSWVTLTFNPPTTFGAAVRVMTHQRGESERFLELANMLKAVAEKRPTPHVPVPNDKAIDVRGWSKTEIEQILADFTDLYHVPTEAVTVLEPRNGIITLRFPADIEPRLFLFLVNYLYRPEHLDPALRSISARGTCVLTANFNLPEPSLVGRRATFFVPPKDRAFDCVMATIDSGETYRIPLTNLRWHVVTAADPRPRGTRL